MKIFIFVRHSRKEKHTCEIKRFHTYTKYNKICFEYSDFKYNIACVFNTKKMTKALDQSALEQFLRLFRGWIMKYLSDLR